MGIGLFPLLMASFIFHRFFFCLTYMPYIFCFYSIYFSPFLFHRFICSSCDLCLLGATFISSSAVPSVRAVLVSSFDWELWSVWSSDASHDWSAQQILGTCCYPIRKLTWKDIRDQNRRPQLGFYPHAGSVAQRSLHRCCFLGRGRNL